MESDIHLRYVCIRCETVHYQNPKLVCGCLVYQEDKILLCRRAIEPRHGLWTLPAGFMENGESTRQGAERETFEEACATITTKELFVIANLTHISQVYMLYLAELGDATFSPGVESLEVQLFAEDEIPWEQLAFHTVDFAIKRFYEDRKKGYFSQHEIDFPQPG